MITALTRRSRLAALTAVSLSGALMLAGCTSGSGNPSRETGGEITSIAAPASPQTIELWSGFGGPDAETFATIVKSIDEEEPNLTIDLVPQPEIDTKVRTAAKTGNLPDGAITTDPVAWAADGFVAPMDDFVSAARIDKADYPAGVWEHAEFSGKRWGMPWDVQPLVLFWNKSLYAQAGLDPDSGPTDRTEFVDYAKQIQEKTGQSGTAIVTGGAGLTPALWAALAFQGGMTFTNADNTKVTFNDKAGVAAAEFLNDLVKKDKVSPPNVPVDGEISSFIQGKTGMIFCGVWETNHMKQALGDNLGAEFIPALMGKGSWGSSQHMVTFKKNMTTAHKEALYYFWEQLIKKSPQWAVSGSLPAQAAIRASSEFQKLQPQATIAKGIDSVKLLPAFPGGSDLLSGVGAAGEAVVGYLGNGTPIQQSLDTAAARYTKILTAAKKKYHF